ncbi:class I SAM-dependent methyltransferase [Methylacidimicrobium sp. B4]|uniref:class I SAM-dependent methyltransferase n=1 Tax=Methylacidimicrobium sp. B4 TaxID=2796139 RepID=UPI001A90BE6B|nr:methyltransferase domain-containing protein [Methylacidimicrobium sp. B4]QSR84843.1 methyltransferase domain-containing protein [Methylacidimicrobium sp. B4]
MRAQGKIDPENLLFRWCHSPPAISLSLLLLATAIGFGRPALFDSPRLAEEYDRKSAAQYEIGRELLSLLGISPGSSVLDLGCGTGQIASWASRIAGPKGKVLGIDPSPYRIALAERRARRGLAFAVAGSRDLPAFPSGSFDVVYLNYVLHWIDDRRQALREIRRILKPGGKLGISFEDTSRPSEIDEIIERSAKEVLGTLPPALFLATAPLGLAQLKEMLRQNGFRVLKVKVVESEDRAKTPAELLDFWRASSAGRFLSGVSPGQRQRIERRIIERLVARSGSDIRISGETLLLVAEREASRPTSGPSHHLKRRQAPAKNWQAPVSGQAGQ